MIQTKFPDMTGFIRTSLKAHFTETLSSQFSSDPRGRKALERITQKHTDDWFEYYTTQYDLPRLCEDVGITLNEFYIRQWLSCSLGATTHGFADSLDWVVSAKHVRKR